MVHFDHVHFFQRLENYAEPEECIPTTMPPTTTLPQETARKQPTSSTDATPPPKLGTRDMKPYSYSPFFFHSAWSLFVYAGFRS